MHAAAKLRIFPTAICGQSQVIKGTSMGLSSLDFTHDMLDVFGNKEGGQHMRYSLNARYDPQLAIFVVPDQTGTRCKSYKKGETPSQHEARGEFQNQTD